MKLKKITYETLRKLFENCNVLIETYKSDDSLTMELEWCLLQNYKALNNEVNDYNKQVQIFVDKYGTLQPDGTRKLDTTSNVVMELYNKELKELQNKQKTVKIETVSHKSLKGLKGVTLETMLLLDFMIE